MKEIAKNLDPISELGPKLQALQALADFGEDAGSQVDAIVPLLKDEDPMVLRAALTTLAKMGEKGRPALDELEKTEKHWIGKRGEKRRKDPEVLKYVATLTDAQKKVFFDNLNEEMLRRDVAFTIKYIKDSKPGKPGGDVAVAAPPKTDDKKP